VHYVGHYTFSLRTPLQELRSYYIATGNAVKMKRNMLSQTQLSYILLVLATSVDRGRPPSGQNIYKNLKAIVYKVLFISIMGLTIESSIP
jgi:hypothetical protein